MAQASPANARRSLPHVRRSRGQTPGWVTASPPTAQHPVSPAGGELRGQLRAAPWGGARTVNPPCPGGSLQKGGRCVRTEGPLQKPSRCLGGLTRAICAHGSLSRTFFLHLFPLRGRWGGGRGDVSTQVSDPLTSLNSCGVSAGRQPLEGESPPTVKRSDWSVSVRTQRNVVLNPLGGGKVRDGSPAPVVAVT